MKRALCALVVLVFICAMCVACATPQPLPDPAPVIEEPYVNRMYLNAVYNKALDVVVSLDMTKENVEARLGAGDSTKTETQANVILYCDYDDIIVGYSADDLVCRIFIEESGDWVVKYGFGIGDSIQTLETQFAYSAEKLDEAAVFYMNDIHIFTQHEDAAYHMRFAVLDNKIQSIELAYPMTDQGFA